MQEIEGDPKPEQTERLLASHWRQTLTGGGWGCNTPDRKDDLGPQRSRKLEVSIPLSKPGMEQDNAIYAWETHKLIPGAQESKGGKITSLREMETPKPDPESKFIP